LVATAKIWIRSETIQKIYENFSVAADCQGVATEKFGANLCKWLKISGLGVIYAHFLGQKFVAADYQAVATDAATNFWPLFHSYALIISDLQPSSRKSTENFYYSIYIYVRISTNFIRYIK
jgi:hypothetical protein